jgi:uncharacterized membrane protein YidH (DUF202 family)
VFFVPYAAVGALLVTLRPGNPVSWLLLAMGFGFIPTSPPQDLDLAALEAGTASGRDFLIAWLSSWGGSLGFMGFLVLSLVFPTGRLPAGRWRGAAIALLAVDLALVLLSATAPSLSFNPDLRLNPIVVPNRLAVLPDLPLWSVLPTTDALSLLAVLVLPAIGACSMLVRYRHSSGVERLQLRWLTAAIGLVVIGVAIGLGVFAIFGGSLGVLGWIPALIAYLGVPLAIGIAILRYRLFDIDRIISRTLTYGLLTVLLVGVYAAGFALLQALLAPVTSGGGPVAVAASTLVVFALFQPLRRRVQTAMDRRFNRSRYDAQQTVTGFAAQLRDEVDLDRLRGELHTVVGRSLAPASVGIWLRPSERTAER